MKNISFKSIAASSAALIAAATLVACAPQQSGVTFDTVKPWHDVAASYERLEYSAAIYDVSSSTDADKRVKIADGVLTYTLTENSRTEGAVAYSELVMDFSVTYGDSAPEADRGKTDSIRSVTEFQNDSLVASRMNKSVTLASRDDAENKSYDLAADYFGEQKATLTETGVTPNAVRTLDIGNSTYYDNETMFYLARATAIGAGKSANFLMTNLYQSFDVGKFSQYTMLASGASETSSLNIGDFVKDFGVEQVTAEDGSVSYPVSCYHVSIMINADKHGPPYIVDYSEKPFKSGDKEHSKIPVLISYTEYSGRNPHRVTEYTLVGCSFDRPTQA